MNASWEIDLWGRIRRQVEAARATLYASVEARKGVILSLVASVANTYIQLRSLDEQLAISLSTLKSYGESVEYFTKQFKYGQSSKMTLVQAETQYEIAAAKIPQLQAEIIQTEDALSVLLGSNPSKIARGKSIRDLHLPSVPADLPSRLLRSCARCGRCIHLGRRAWNHHSQIGRNGLDLGRKFRRQAWYRKHESSPHVCSGRSAWRGQC